MFGEPKEFFETIAELSNLQEGANGVQRIVVNLYRNQESKITNKEFSRIVGIPVPVISAVKGELIKKGLLETKNILSSPGKIWIEKQLNLRFSAEFFMGYIWHRKLRYL